MTRARQTTEYQLPLPVTAYVKPSPTPPNDFYSHREKFLRPMSTPSSSPSNSSSYSSPASSADSSPHSTPYTRPESIPDCFDDPYRWYHQALREDPPTKPKSLTASLVAPFKTMALTQLLLAVSQSIFCLIYIILGQALLKAAHFDGFTASISSSAKIGAIGGLIVTIPALVLCRFRGKGLLYFVFCVAVDTVFGATAGPLGLAILQGRLGQAVTLDPAHAAQAGALGAVVISSAMNLLARM
jgi:hypothetical protein